MNTTAGRRVGLVIAGLLVMQLGWLVTIPPFRGSDEVDHAYRAAAVARGEWVAGEYAADGRGWLVTVPETLVAAARGQCEELGYTGPDNCRAVATVGDDAVLVASSAAGYPPAYYWLVGSAGVPFEGAASLYAMRIASALLCLLFLGLAAWALLGRDTRWPAAGLVLAASPVLVYSTIVVAPNGLEMTAALSLWAALLSLPHAEGSRHEQQLLWTAIASAAVVGSLRLIGPIFVLMILATVLLLHGRRLVVVLRRRGPTCITGAGLVSLGVASFAWWTFGPHVLEPATSGPDGGSGFAVVNLVLWPLQSIAAFPYRDQMGPSVVYVVVGTLVVTLFVLAVRWGTPREKWVLLLAMLVALALPIVLTLATMDGRGVIWQGRYGLPYSVGFVLIAGYVMGRHAPSSRLPWVAVVPSAAALAFAVGACLVKVRQTELADNTASRLDAAWHVPSPLLLGVLSLAAMACLAGAVGGGFREPG